MSLPSVRQCLGVIVVVFIAYAVFTSPTQSADVAGNAWDQIKNGFHHVSTFFDELLDS